MAGELVVSVWTVERHIANIYLKINAPGRLPQKILNAWAAPFLRECIQDISFRVRILYAPAQRDVQLLRVVAIIFSVFLFNR